MSSRRPPPATCANCGAALPRHARACPECGADEHTGWRDASIYDDLDLPDSAFAAAGTTSPQGRPRHPLKSYWLAAAVLVLIVLVLGALALW